MKNNVIIVGAGINGLMCAYYLTRVLAKDYLNLGLFGLIWYTAMHERIWRRAFIFDLCLV